MKGPEVKYHCAGVSRTSYFVARQAYSPTNSEPFKPFYSVSNLSRPTLPETAWVVAHTDMWGHHAQTRGQTTINEWLHSPYTGTETERTWRSAI